MFSTSCRDLLCPAPNILHGFPAVCKRRGEEDGGCGTYDKLHANTTDAALEKHLPVVEVKKDVVQAKVGADDHPMDEDHYITWVYLETTRGGSLRVLKPGDQPQVEFRLSDGERPLAVYEYCNRHGLWKAELAQE